MQQLKNKQGKNENKSESLRIKGNSYFQRKEYFDCCHYYTRSLCYAVKNSANYGLALANRSAALFHIGDFEVILFLLLYRVSRRDWDRRVEANIFGQI